MASVPLRSTAVVAAPKDYSIPNAQQIRLLTVTASFVDAGAAGDWLPAVVILDNNGNALVRAVDQGVKVTAGLDAEVSWFPSVKPASASVTPSSATLPFAYVSQNGHTLCPAMSTTNLDATAGRFYTNSPSIFSFNTNGIEIDANGHYLSVITAGPFGLPSSGTAYEIQTNGGGELASFEWPPTNILFPGGVTTDYGRVSEGVIMTVGAAVSPPTSPIFAQILNESTFNVNMTMTGNMVVQLDTDTTELF